MNDTPDFITPQHSNFLNTVNMNKNFYDDYVTDYLIRWTKEDNQKFNWRKDVTYFLNFVEPTVTGLVNILYRKPLKLKNTPKEGVTSDNRDLSEFMRQVTTNAIRDGLTVITQNSNQTNGYLENYEANQIINYRLNNNQLVQITFRDTYSKYSGNFQQLEIERFKVIRLGGGEIWERDSSLGNLKLTESWENNLDFLPVTILYLGNYIKPFDCKSAIQKIVNLNNSHYNLKSGVMNICHIASNPVPIIFGDLKNDNVVIGVNEPLIFEDKESGDFQWREVTGNSVKVSTDEIKQIEEYIYKQSFSILKEEPYQTATQARIENNKGKGILNGFSKSIEVATINSLENLDLVMGRKKESYDVLINKDFDDILIDSVAIANMINLQKNGQISLETLWDMLARGEILNENFDSRLEKERIESETMQGLV